MCAFQTDYVAGKLYDGELHAEAQAEEWYIVFACILDSGDFAFDSAVAKAPRHEDTAHVREQFVHIFRSYSLRVNPFDIDYGVVVNAAVFQCFYYRNVGVMKLDVFSDKGTVTSVVGGQRLLTISVQSVRSGSGHGRFRHSQAT